MLSYQTFVTFLACLIYPPLLALSIFVIFSPFVIYSILTVSTHSKNKPAVHTKNTTLTQALSCTRSLRQYTFTAHQPSLAIVPPDVDGSRHGWGLSLRTKWYSSGSEVQFELCALASAFHIWSSYIHAYPDSISILKIEPPGSSTVVVQQCIKKRVAVGLTHSIIKYLLPSLFPVKRSELITSAWVPLSLDCCLYCADVIKSQLIWSVLMRPKIRPKHVSALS